MKWFRRKKDLDTNNSHSRVSWIPLGILRTHTGHVRDHNEDSVILYTSHQENGESPTLAIVADGMGGHAAGEVASSICIDTFVHVMQESVQIDPVGVLSEGMHTANHAIFSAAKNDPAYHGMGTTCSALLIKNGDVWIANVGDSRVYQFVDGQLTQITRDDTVVNQWVSEGRITREEALNHPDANILSQALGTKPKVSCVPQKVSQIFKPGDRFLLCSDGLYDMVDDPDISQLMKLPDVMSCTEELVALALKNGGRDNVSVIIIECTTPAIEEKKDKPTGIHQTPDIL